METPKRIFFVDNLKGILALLVVFHHAAMPYVEGVWWHVQSPHQSYLLEPFIAINAAFFMGLFFFVSSFFIKGSLDRKGILVFLKDRSIRLGLPIIFFALTIIPIILYAYFINFRHHTDMGFFAYFTQIYLGFGPVPYGWTGPIWPDFQLMHLWFIAHLLLYAAVFSFLYALGRPRLYPSSRNMPVSPLGRRTVHLGLLTYVLALFLVTFVTRIWYPIGHWSILLGIIPVEVGHLPQYLSLFVMGIVASHKRLLDRIPASTGRLWLAVGIASALLRFGQMFLWEINPWHLLRGSVSWQGAVYVLWETLVVVGLSVGLLTFFKKRLDFTNRFLRILSQNAYAVYLIHMPVVVVLQYLTNPLQLPAELVFLIVGGTSVFLSVSISHLVLRRSQTLKRILY